MSVNVSPLVDYCCLGPMVYQVVSHVLVGRFQWSAVALFVSESNFFNFTFLELERFLFSLRDHLDDNQITVLVLGIA